MNPFPALLHTLRNASWRVVPFAALAGTCLLALRLPPRQQGDASLYLAKAAAFFMLYQASSAATRLAHAARVLTRRQAPAAAWTGSVATCMAGTSASGLAVLAVLVLHWALSGATAVPVILHIATVSVAACVGTVFSALRSGLLARLPTFAAAACIIMFLPAYVVYGHQALIFATTISAQWLLPAAMAWPVVALLLYRRWQTIPPLSAPVAVTTAMPSWIPGLSRTVFLQPRFGSGHRWQNTVFSSLQMGLASMYCSMREPLAVGDTVSVFHLLSLAGLVPIAMLMANVRDLHWRTLLLPRSSLTRLPALGLYAGTLKVIGTTIACMCVGLVLFDYLLFGNGPELLLPRLGKWALLAAEAPLVAAMALLLMALLPPRQATYAACAASVAIMAVSLALQLPTVAVPGLRLGAAYGAGIAVLSALLMAAAGRWWTPRRLLAYLPERPVSLAAITALTANSAVSAAR